MLLVFSDVWYDILSTGPWDIDCNNYSLPLSVLHRALLMSSPILLRRLKKRRRKSIKPLWRKMRSKSNISVRIADNLLFTVCKRVVVLKVAIDLHFCLYCRHVASLGWQPKVPLWQPSSSMWRDCQLPGHHVHWPWSWGGKHYDIPYIARILRYIEIGFMVCNSGIQFICRNFSAVVFLKCVYFSPNSCLYSETRIDGTSGSSDHRHAVHSRVGEKPQGGPPRLLPSIFCQD